MPVHSIRQIAQHATDLEASLRFYAEVLGGRFMAKFDPPGLVFVEIGGVRILLENNAPPATLYFGVDDITAACEDLKAKGVPLEGDPHCIFPDGDGTFGPPGEEEWMAFFRDPAGNMLAFSSRQRPVG